MKCPHCGVEVEQGTLFCPECLTEIPWVPEYNTVETLMTKEKTKKVKAQEKKTKHRTEKKKSLKKILGVSVFALVLILAATKLIWDLKNYYSFDYQFGKAGLEYEKENYDGALKHIDRAMELDEDSEKVNILYARILAATDDTEAAIAYLETFLDDYPDSLELYGAFIEIYENAGMMEEIHQLLSNCKETEVLTAFSDYISEDPGASVETGVYNEELQVELTCSNGTIYYTLDGSDPTEESSVYNSPISITEGVTELKALCINEKQVPSDVIYKKYTVVIKGPDAPLITPEEGTYAEPMTITMEVPEGCKGYYAFDNPQVSTASQEYTGPVQMPEGTHVFYGILVAANGKESDTVSKNYTYTPVSEGTE